MRRLIVLCLMGCVAATVLTGCHTNFTNPTPAALAARRELTTAQRSFDAYWRASLEVLRSYEFELDRQDRRAGILTTKPMLGRHFFEVWRRDAVTYYDMTESTLQSIYRAVTVQLVPGAEAGVYEPKVTVSLQRLNKPSDGPPSASAAMALVSPSQRRERKRTLRAASALPDGRTQVGEHQPLARKLAGEIRAKAARLLGRPAPSPVKPEATKPVSARPAALPNQ